MPDEYDPVEILHFEKPTADGLLIAQAEVFDDGSVYITGDEVEIGFEWADDCRSQAIAYLEKRGYMRTISGGDAGDTRGED
jgi:hypothetical protein